MMPLEKENTELQGNPNAVENIRVNWKRKHDLDCQSEKIGEQV